MLIRIHASLLSIFQAFAPLILQKRPLSTYINMPRKDYLSADQRSRFDAPSELQDMRILFEIPHWAETFENTYIRYQQSRLHFTIGIL